MRTDCQEDDRQVPDNVMYYIRRMAVHAIRVLGLGPETVAKAYNFHRSSIYRWLKQYDEGGFDALESRMPPDETPVITAEMDICLKAAAALNKTPLWFDSHETEQLLDYKFPSRLSGD
jgi:transposase